MSKAVKLLLYIGILSHDPTNAMISCSAIGKFTRFRLSLTQEMIAYRKNDALEMIGDALNRLSRKNIIDMDLRHAKWSESEKLAAQQVSKDNYIPSTGYDLYYWCRCLQLAKATRVDFKYLYSVHQAFKSREDFMTSPLHPIDMALDMLEPLV